MKGSFQSPFIIRKAYFRVVENNQVCFFYQANILTSSIKKKKSLKYEQKGLAKPGVSVCSEITFPFGDREPGQQT